MEFKDYEKLVRYTMDEDIIESEKLLEIYNSIN